MAAPAADSGVPMAEERCDDNSGDPQASADRAEPDAQFEEEEDEILEEVDWVRPVEIEDDDEDEANLDAAVGRWTALAHYVSRRRYSARTMFDELGSVWRTEHKMTYKDLGDNLFQLDFYGEADYKFVIKGGTWHHRHDVVIVVPFGREECAADARPLAFPIWVRVYDLPRKLMTRKKGTALLEQLGEVLEVDTDDGEQASGPFLRVRLCWPIRQPLVYTLPVSRKERVTRHNIRYERVPNFCFFCGRIGHDRKECKLEVVPHPGCRYGPELRVSPFKKFDARRFTVKGRKPSAARKLFDDEDESSFGGSHRPSGLNSPAASRVQSPERSRSNRRASPPAHQGKEGDSEKEQTEANKTAREDLVRDLQDRLRVRESPVKSAPTPHMRNATVTERAAKMQEVTGNLKRTFDGLRELRKQWEEMAAKQKPKPPNSKESEDTKGQEPSVNSPSVKSKVFEKEEADPSAHHTESKRFCEVTGINYRIYKNRRGTVNQLKIRELFGNKGGAELRANSLLGKRVADFDMAHAHEEGESSFEVLLGLKRIRREEVSTANNAREAQRKPAIRRYEIMWEREPSLAATVEEAWSRRVEVRDLGDICSSLRQVMGSLYDWRKHHFKPVSKEIDSKRKKLEALMALSDDESARARQLLSNNSSARWTSCSIGKS
ncbi:hypothetical protein ACQ4PT_003978 [Festuca glaucescens]